MPRTVTAYFDTQVEAEAPRSRLVFNFDVESATIVDGDGSPILEQFDPMALPEAHAVDLSYDGRSLHRQAPGSPGFMMCAEVNGANGRDEIVAVLAGSEGTHLT